MDRELIDRELLRNVIEYREHTRHNYIDGIVSMNIYNYCCKAILMYRTLSNIRGNDLSIQRSIKCALSAEVLSYFQRKHINKQSEVEITNVSRMYMLTVVLEGIEIKHEPHSITDNIRIATEMFHIGMRVNFKTALKLLWEGLWS